MRLPVEQVSYDTAVEYLNALSVYENRPACYQQNSGVWVVSDFACEGYRLPTEAEWEYSARAGTTSSHNGSISNGVCSDNLVNQVAWYCGNATGSTHGVGKRHPMTSAFMMFTETLRSGLRIITARLNTVLLLSYLPPDLWLHKSYDTWRQLRWLCNADPFGRSRGL